MKKFLFGAIILLSPQITFSQTVVKPGMDAVKHTVVSGETVLDISKKYVVDPAEIYRANRFAIDGVKEGMVLEFYAPQKSPVIDIPDEKYITKTDSKEPEIKLKKTVEEPKEVQKSEAKVTKVTNRLDHKVKAGETLYGLSKLYNVSVDELKNANTILMNNNLQAGQTLVIPDGTIVGNNKNDSVVQQKKEVQSVTIKPNAGEIFKHTVAPKETLYGLSKKYNVSIDAILSQNERVLKNGLQAGQVLTIKAN
ncbi:MAG: hypothetical protein CVU07_10630 [Bacteroidetes bacterium HGW-Bacteroidetes-23]|nr:MAG: hypothetical protein CVU07_10630 [Bacteroidetes bacterium HGW-Bacteroidetes-23]